jgi:hypothetical protein
MSERVFLDESRRVVSLPWGINRLANMIGGSDIQASRDGTRWYRAVPAPYIGSLHERARAAWWVLTGRAHAIVWPETGDLERAIAPTNQGEQGK